MTMQTATFCREVEADVTQEEIDQRVDELKTLGGAIDAYAKTVGGKRYICTVREVYDEQLDDGVNDPEREGPVVDPAPPAVAGRGNAAQPAAVGRAATAAAGGLLTDEDYRRAAAALRCEAAAIRAVADIESGGRTGFLSDGRPKILFESHVFSKLTGGNHDATHPDISTARWTRNYIGGAGEHDRLRRAMQLDREAALKSASWGKFQILGMNHRRVGSNTVDEFVEAQKRSEKEHLDAFVKFILSHDLSDELRDRRWDDFARRYNGPRFAENGYDRKMAEAYARYVAGSSRERSIA
jgi:N-acetylmuramidase